MQVKEYFFTKLQEYSKKTFRFNKRSVHFKLYIVTMSVNFQKKQGNLLIALLNSRFI